MVQARYENDYDFMADAKCKNKDPEIFFPGSGSGGVREATDICDECPVEDLCLEYALKERIDHGVWGGKSERERQRILRQRRIGAISVRLEDII